MSDTREMDPPTQETERGGEDRRKLPRWKKVLLACAAILVVSGIGLKAVDLVRGGGEGGASGGGVARDGTFANPRNHLTPGALVAGDRPSPRGEPRRFDLEDEGLSRFSPALVKGGLSFFVGFCVGFAVRAFIKVSAAILGVCLLVLFGLSYAGWVQVDWVGIEQHFDRFLAALSDQASGFKSFVEGSLPSAAMASLGLFTGVKKN